MSPAFSGPFADNGNVLLLKNIIRRVQNFDEASDIRQDCWVEFISNLRKKKYAAEIPHQAILFQLSKFKSYKHIEKKNRREKKLRFDSSLTDKAQTPAGTHKVEARLHHQELKNMVIHFISGHSAGLTSTEKRVILGTLANKDMAVLARELNKSTGRIYKIKYAAKEKLRNYQAHLEKGSSRDEDSALFDLLMMKGKERLKNGCYAHAKKIFEHGLKLSKDSSLKEQALQASCSIGTVFRNQCKFLTAERYFRALLASGQLSESIRFLCLYELCICSKSLRKHLLALEYAREGLESARKQNNKQFMARIINAQGTIYDGVGEYGSALACYRDAIGLTEKIHDGWLLSTILGNYSLTYLNMSDFDQGIGLAQKACALAHEIRNTRGMAENLDNFCELYIKIKEPEKVRKHALYLIDLARENHFDQLLSKGHDYLGQSYMLEGKINKAEKCFNEADQYSRRSKV